MAIDIIIFIYIANNLLFIYIEFYAYAYFVVITNIFLEFG